MKIINDNGRDITKEFNEAMAKIRETLEFYVNGKHYHWDGCSCHGHYEIDDGGATAEDGIRALNLLEDEIKGEWDIEDETP